MRRFLLWGLAAVVGLLVVAALTIYVGMRVASDPLPEGVDGPEAEALADRIEKSVGMQSWNSTAAVAFQFEGPRGGPTAHFRDFKRDLVEVSWREKDATIVVQFDKQSNSNRATRDGSPVTGAELATLVDRSTRRHINDFFWLNPMAAIRAPGTIRKRVGDRALLVTFSSGGVTPGDSYLFVTDGSGQPVAIRMWVSVLTLKGIAFSMDSWIRTDTGARLNSFYKSVLFSTHLRNIRTYASYPAPGERDRFWGLPQPKSDRKK